MKLNDKIKQILIDKRISPSHFADEIGIQRSSVSHILTGRNKPSLDIIQKIVKRYPDLGLKWILDEEELPVLDPEPTTYAMRSFPSVKAPTTKRLNSVVPDSSIGRETYDNLLKNVKEDEPNKLLDVKAIERILIFYSDGTFRQYTPQ